MKKRIISTRCYRRDQSWYFEQVVKFSDASQTFKLKVNIRRNAFDDQSGAQVFMWSGTGWNSVVEAPISECHCRGVSYCVDDVKASDFESDCERLLTEAKFIVVI